MTAVETSCSPLSSPAPQADEPERPASEHVRRPTTIPAPSATRAARKRYWEDTVHEAIAELRQRLGSNRETVSTLALLTIIEVEKHKMRHGRPVSGTETCHMREDEDPHPLPKLAPLDEPSVAPSATERSGRSASGPVPQSTTPGDPPAPRVRRPATAIPITAPDPESLVLRDEEGDALWLAVFRAFRPILDECHRSSRPVRARADPSARAAGRWPSGG